MRAFKSMTFFFKCIIIPTLQFPVPSSSRFSDHQGEGKVFQSTAARICSDQSSICLDRSGFRCDELVTVAYQRLNIWDSICFEQGRAYSEPLSVLDINSALTSGS